MDWEQKLHALNSLAECSLKMRSPGDWYVSQRVEIKDRDAVKSVSGNGLTPFAAVYDHWTSVTAALKPHQYVVVGAYGDGRVAVRWNGFMWAKVDEKVATAAQTAT